VSFRLLVIGPGFCRAQLRVANDENVAPDVLIERRAILDHRVARPAVCSLESDLAARLIGVIPRGAACQRPVVRFCCSIKASGILYSSIAACRPVTPLCYTLLQKRQGGWLRQQDYCP
jgi:hypothetical protein